MPAETGSQSMAWLTFALMTVLSWGLYGAFLHSGALKMAAGGDPVIGRYKAFLFVGIAYFITAVLAPILMLMFQKGGNFQFSTGGMWWSLIAGILGAIGAFCVLLAFGAGGHPGVVMSIIFAGAPVINGLYVFVLSKSHGGNVQLNWQFIAGMLLAAAGGFMVTYYKPAPVHGKSTVEQKAADNPAKTAFK